MKNSASEAGGALSVSQLSQAFKKHSQPRSYMWPTLGPPEVFATAGWKAAARGNYVSPRPFAPTSRSRNSGNGLIAPSVPKIAKWRCGEVARAFPVFPT